MEALFVGGASNIGGSCLAIEIGGRWIVIDAGVRINRQDDPLPNLALLQDKPVCAIFVTHAHADHIGALPLLHQAYPWVPIFASRATGLLMEIMLADALKIMERRAAEEMELPLYDPALVASMLNQLRPLPVGEDITLTELPEITIHASWAGHIAGAVSFSFRAPDGTLVVSGDISITDQLTVSGAVTPPMVHPDLLILESTYGARLHANRQAEEQRLVQSVAQGIARGGHVLIPCFGLGRGQEVLLLLVEAQRRGLIPSFPLYVDGLVRRVCSTYHLIPEALTLRLERQIRKGYYPFTGRLVTFVRDEQERAQILANAPACIISSSGVLTGGPSRWYAARLASQEQASIFFTGYADEEAPAQRLLDLAEQGNKTLNIDGTSIPVRCQVAKYNLSAHADGGELASYVLALKPRRVALVHGDEEARAALRVRLSGTEVIFPSDGETLSLSPTEMPLPHSEPPLSPHSRYVTGIGNGLPFSPAHLENLWQVCASEPELRVVTVRELALIWDGKASEETTSSILEALTQDSHHRFFAPMHILEEAFQVRSREQAFSNPVASRLVGQILLVQVDEHQQAPALCHSLVPSASVSLEFAPGVTGRQRYPYSAILEILGPLPETIDAAHVPAFLADLSLQAGPFRRALTAKELAAACQESESYQLDDLCVRADISSTDLAARLAVARLVFQHPHIFYARQTFLRGNGSTLYVLSPDWRQASEKRDLLRPGAILQIIDDHLGRPPDLYRRHVNPLTGKVMLYFHFPLIAQKRYQKALQAAQAEAGVSIGISPQAQQAALEQAIQQVLPEGLVAKKHPSVYQEQQRVHLDTSGPTTEAQLEEARARFQEMTGWQLTIAGATLIGSQLKPALPREGRTVVATPRGEGEPFSEREAIYCAEGVFTPQPGVLQINAEPTTQTLTISFQFPDVALKRHQPRFQALSEQTGWVVVINTDPSSDALCRVAKQVLPEQLRCDGEPMLLFKEKRVRLSYYGQADYDILKEAKTSFSMTTGWTLELVPTTNLSVPPPTTDEVPQETVLADTQKAWNMTEALQYAQRTLGPLSGYLRVGVETDTTTLVPRFHFPHKAKERYHRHFAAIAATTGWNVRLHPFPHTPSIKESLARLLPTSLMLNSELSISQEVVRVVCSGEATAEAVEQAQQQFVAETGFRFELRPSSLSGEDEPQMVPSLPRIQALAHVFTLLPEAHDLYQVGGDEKSHTIWLHFHFPDRARIAYAPQIERFVQETGWQIKIGDDALPQALLAEAMRLLPDGVIITKKVSQREQQTLRLTCTGDLTNEQKETIARRFMEVTGWLLDITITGKPALHISSSLPDQLHEAEAQGAIADILSQRGASIRRIAVDRARHLLLIELESGQHLVDSALLTALEHQTGWQLRLAVSSAGVADALNH